MSVRSEPFTRQWAIEKAIEAKAQHFTWPSAPSSPGDKICAVAEAILAFICEEDDERKKS